MSYIQSTVCALLLTIAAGLSNPAFAGISFGYHGGHHGGHGFRIGLHHGHHGLHGRHGYHGRRHYRYRHYGRYYRGHGGYPYYGARYYRPHRYYGSRNIPDSREDSSYTSRRRSPTDNGTGYDTGQDGNQEGWNILVNGNYGVALSVFGREARANPGAGLPKAGYAIAVASSGDLEKGAWAMRRAFRYEPGRLSMLASKTELHPTIDELIARYEYALRHERGQRDEAFMVSALNYLKGEREAADAAASRAAKAGDTSKSFENLRRLLASESLTGDHEAEPDTGDY